MKKIMILAIGIFLSNSWSSFAGGEIRTNGETRQTIIKILEQKVGGENPGEEKNSRMALHTCVSDEVGIRFTCNPNWRLSRVDKALTITLSLIPEVQIVIGENSRLKFLSDFSREAIASMGRFEEGFDVERIQNCGRETVKVTGYLKNDPNTKILSFFMIDHNKLHSVEFIVKPKEEWGLYEDVIFKVANSLEFSGEEKSVLKFNLTPTDENCGDLIK